MLIIFDLDDTLVDTSRVLTPFRLKEALLSMQASGMPIPHFEAALEILIQIDKKAPNAESALRTFLQEMGNGLQYLQKGLDSIYRSKNFNFPIECTPDATTVVKGLSKSHKLAIVSVGEEMMQREKLKKSGLDVTLFSMIVVTPHKDKKKIYQEIVTQLGFRPEEVLVCGDKIDIDLVPAKELGFKTVHMKNGRGAFLQGSKRDVDFTIGHLQELEEIVKSINNIIER